MMRTGLVFNVQRFSIHDGPGVRTTVFLKGCPLACTWCHNPESQALSPTYVRLPQLCMRCGHCTDDELDNPVVVGRGDCDVAECPTGALRRVGDEMAATALVKTLLRDRVFFDESGGGVTVSGGEPLVQAPFVIELLRLLRAEGVHTALDTCGFAPWPNLRDAAELADLVLYDVKLLDAGRHETATGVSNGLILDNLRALAGMHSDVWVRVPVIPGVNDDDANVRATAEFLRSIPSLRRIDLLPYHPSGEAKFVRLGKRYALHGTAAPAPEQLNAIAARFRANGLTTTIGGQAA